MSINLNIVEKLAKKNFIVFAGTGVDSSAGIPNWENLLRKLIERAREFGFMKNLSVSNENQEEFPKIAQKIYEYFINIGEKNVYFDSIKEFITPRNIPYGTEHLEIVKTTNWVVTTNFSNLFEEAFKSKLEDEGIMEKNIYYESLPDFEIKSHFECPSVIYLHGRTDEEFLVFTEENYRNYYPSYYGNSKGAKDIEDYLKYIYKNFTLVFVGFGFEIAIRETFKKIFKELERSDLIAKEKKGYIPKHKKIRHFCFLKKEKSGDVKKEKEYKVLVEELEKINITVIEMEEYIEWIEYFEEIRDLKRLLRPPEVQNG